VSAQYPAGLEGYQLPKRSITKTPDFKIAYVTLPENEKFEFPEIFPEEKTEKVETKEEEQQGHFRREAILQQRRDWDRAGAPGWFGL